MTNSARGAVIRLAEADYRYGVGPLTIRLERVDRTNPISRDNEIWLIVEGLELAWDGSSRGWRQVLVRVSALQKAIAHATYEEG
jgi:hypothetical protein